MAEKCPECNRIFKTGTGLGWHLQHIHELPRSEEKPPKGPPANQQSRTVIFHWPADILTSDSDIGRKMVAELGKQGIVVEKSSDAPGKVATDEKYPPTWIYLRR